MSRNEFVDESADQEYSVDNAGIFEDELQGEISTKSDYYTNDMDVVRGSQHKNKEKFNQELRLVNDYFKEVGHEPMLTPREELEIAAKIKDCRVKADITRKVIFSMLGGISHAENEVDIGELKLILEKVSLKRRLGRDKWGRLQRLVFTLESYNKTCERLRERFTNANLRLVASMAKNFVGRGVPFLDIIQEGNLGLMKAVERYDYKKGFRFSTYASWWINQAMTRGIYNQKRTVKIPAYVLEKAGKVWRERAKFVKKNGREPDAGEISTRINMSCQNVKHVLESNNANNTVQLDAPVWMGGNVTFMDYIEDSETQPVDSLMAEVSIPYNVKQALLMLEERQREVIRMRFGIGYSESYTLDEIGKKFGLTRERIRQIERKALDAIRNSESAPALRSLFDMN